MIRVTVDECFETYLRYQSKFQSCHEYHGEWCNGLKYWLGIGLIAHLDSPRKPSEFRLDKAATIRRGEYANQRQSSS